MENVSQSGLSLDGFFLQLDVELRHLAQASSSSKLHVQFARFLLFPSQSRYVFYILLLTKKDKNSQQLKTVEHSVSDPKRFFLV
jgi:hypothetical protein